MKLEGTAVPWWNPNGATGLEAVAAFRRANEQRQLEMQQLAGEFGVDSLRSAVGGSSQSLGTLSEAYNSQFNRGAFAGSFAEFVTEEVVRDHRPTLAQAAVAAPPKTVSIAGEPQREVPPMTDELPAPDPGAGLFSQFALLQATRWTGDSE
jgi:hypothetical protein